MRTRPKLHMFFSGFCLGGLLLAFRNTVPTLNPNDVIVVIIGVVGFLCNLYLGVRDDLRVDYRAHTRIWLKSEDGED